MYIKHEAQQSYSGEPSEEIKLAVFSGDNYTIWDAMFSPPDVCHVRWEPQDWVKWVDNNGMWVRK